jgi:hypothetical protein
MRRIVLLAMALFVLNVFHSSAQKASVSTNLLDYACLGTFNVEASYSLSRHCSITASVRYNPFTFYKGEQRQFQYRQQSYAVGVRAWPWHSYSGWWFAGKVRYQEYNVGGIFTRETEEGDKAGLSVCAGYSLMISRHFNVEFGLGLWSGAAWYRKYSCQSCGLTIEDGRKWFLHPDDLMISLAYVF